MRLPHSAAHHAFLLRQRINMKKVRTQSKIIASNVNGVILSMSVYSVSNWHYNSLQTIIKRSWIFAAVWIFPDASRFMFKLKMNKEVSFGSPLSKRFFWIHRVPYLMMLYPYAIWSWQNPCPNYHRAYFLSV